MGVRKSVEELVRRGPLPDSNASEETIALRQVLLQAIRPPVTDEEAALLLGCFGPDECYGLAWALVHLIETAPGEIPIKSEPSASDNEWVRYLWDRAQRKKEV